MCVIYIAVYPMQNVLLRLCTLQDTFQSLKAVTLQPSIQINGLCTLVYRTLQYYHCYKVNRPALEHMMIKRTKENNRLYE